MSRLLSQCTNQHERQVHVSHDGAVAPEARSFEGIPDVLSPEIVM